MYQKLIIIGNLGKDPEMRYAPDGKAVTSFNVAVSDGYGDKRKTLWMRVSAWGKQAETCNEYLRKGSKVLVDGRLAFDGESGNPRTYTRQDGSIGVSFEMNADTVRFLSGREGDKPEPGSIQDDIDNGIPF